jgi:hypothetical protein
MQFVLTGFTHDRGFRVFAFDRIGEDRVRTRCTVRTDLALIKQYGIHIQELPLLCRDFLGRGDEADATPSLIFAEAEMKACADARAAARAAAGTRRKTPHRPAVENLGAAWRGQPAPAV